MDASITPAKKLAEIHAKKSTSSKDILVIGAGISGIIAAYELEKLGHNVQLIEASNRIGGRFWTFHFDTSGKQYGELGAMRIPADHDYVFHYINEANLDSRLTRFVSALNDQNCFVDFGGKISKLHDTIDKPYPENVVLALELALNGTAPPTIRQLFTPEIEREILHMLSENPHLPALDQYVNKLDPRFLVELDPLIKAKGNKGVNLFYHDIVEACSSDLKTIEGGMDLLPKKLAQKLKQPVKFNCEVEQIEVDKDLVKVWVNEKGNTSMMTAEYVICTIPYSVLRHIPLIGCDDKKLEAVSELHYANAGKLLFYCKEPFWEEYGIKGGASFTDHLIRQVYYPSNGSSVMLACYALGEDCDKLSRMDLSNLVAYTKQIIARFHPQILKPGMIKGFHWVEWGTYPWSLGAAGVLWDKTMTENNQSFDISHLRDLVYNGAKPEGRLFFAGEHASLNHAWIQGAILSSVKTVEALQDCILGKEYLHHFEVRTTSSDVAREMRI